MESITNYPNVTLAFQDAYAKMKAGKQVKLYKTNGIWSVEQ